MKKVNLIFALAALALCLLFWYLLMGCNPPNLIMDSNLQAKASAQKHIGQMAAWMEGDSAVFGKAISEMSRDSFYAMAVGGWNIRIKYDRLTWDFQVKPRPHFPDPVPVPIEAKRIPYADVVIGFTKWRDIDYGF